MNRNVMYMSNWIEKLDEFIKITGNDLLLHSGKISHKQALEKANVEYEKYKITSINELSMVEKHFIENLEHDLKKLHQKNKSF